MVKAKKHLGQHFLMDRGIAQNIVDALINHPSCSQQVIEIGPGTGVLTSLLTTKGKDLTLLEIDTESVDYLESNYKKEDFNLLSQDFLTWQWPENLRSTSIIGNFPYNISSQIFFKILEHIDSVPLVVGMLQKEVARRLCAGPGSKEYGILSVLLQAHYNLEYLFSVPPEVFKPPPKVQSGVIRMVRKEHFQLETDERYFRKLVKQAFQLRRKTLWNSLKSIGLPENIKTWPEFSKRAEQLSVEDFVNLSNKLLSLQKGI